MGWRDDHWCVQAFFQQLPALLGVVIGAFATYAATSAAERARWRRSQAVRWDSLRLTAYADYAHAVKKVSTISDTTVVAARVWHESVFRLQRIASGIDVGITWTQAIAATSKARRGFYEAAKADIGIAIGGSPENYEWQLVRMMPSDDAPTSND